jgi:hypothetical protein
MQTITTHYKNGRIYAKSWNGWVKADFDAALSSEANHRAAADKLVKKLNANKSVSWRVKCSAPGVPGLRGADGGWVFIIEYAPAVAPCHMSITVKFMAGTNTGPAYMRAYSWLFPKGVKVHYSADVANGSDIQGNARYAAGVMLGMINEKCAEGDFTPGLAWALADYVELYNGDRLFTLVTA